MELNLSLIIKKLHLLIACQIFTLSRGSHHIEGVVEHGVQEPQVPLGNLQVWVCVWQVKQRPHVLLGGDGRELLALHRLTSRDNLPTKSGVEWIHHPFLPTFRTVWYEAAGGECENAGEEGEWDAGDPHGDSTADPGGPDHTYIAFVFAKPRDCPWILDTLLFTKSHTVVYCDRICYRKVCLW